MSYPTKCLLVIHDPIYPRVRLCLFDTVNMGDTTASPQDTAEAAIRATGEAASAIKSLSAFWESALGKLEPDEQREIIANGLKLTDLNTILKEAEKKQREWEEKTMTFSFRGKEYKANEIWGKIVQGISVFKNFIGNVVAQDVSGKAALPWAVIKLVLGVSRSSPTVFQTDWWILQALEYKQEQLETIGGAMKTVVEIIGYYVEFEALYKNDHWQAVQQLKSAIVDVYTDILRVLCLARAYYTKKGVCKYLHPSKVQLHQFYLQLRSQTYHQSPLRPSHI
mgnify:CR=1 FL=1